jgi:hypothetical protein
MELPGDRTEVRLLGREQPDMRFFRDYPGKTGYIPRERCGLVLLKEGQGDIFLVSKERGKIQGDYFPSGFETFR